LRKREREREVLLSFLLRKQEIKGRESVCAYVCEREGVCVCVCVCVSVAERKSE
jgi:hypothetical protein